MPELPEVETVRRSLVPHVKGAKVVGVVVNRADIVSSGKLTRASKGKPRRGADDHPSLPTRLLQGDVITRLDRRGKQLLIVGKSHRGLIVHLGMSGQLLIAREGAAPPAKHVHISWTLKKPSPKATIALHFRDPRRFGGVLLVDDVRAIETSAWADLGPDALTISAPQLRGAIGASSSPVKAALLNQGAIAGVGNIYADEALFVAKIHPRTIASTLSPTAITSLAKALRLVLAEAVEAGGSSLRDYVNAEGERGGYLTRHRVYGRAGKPCRRCGTTLASARVAQRQTVLCPRCQPER